MNEGEKVAKMGREKRRGQKKGGWFEGRVSRIKGLSDGFI